MKEKEAMNAAGQAAASNRQSAVDAHIDASEQVVHEGGAEFTRGPLQEHATPAPAAIMYEAEAEVARGPSQERAAPAHFEADAPGIHRCTSCDAACTVYCLLHDCLHCILPALMLPALYIACCMTVCSCCLPLLLFAPVACLCYFLLRTICHCLPLSVESLLNRGGYTPEETSFVTKTMLS